MALCTRAVSVNTAPRLLHCAQKTEAEVVVAIAGTIVVAICRPAVTCTVVPTTATINPVRAFHDHYPK